MPRRQLGRYLRQLREQAGLTVKAAAEQMEWSTPTVWRVEKGATSTRSVDVDAMCRIYGADAKTTEALMALAKETKAKGWWHAYGDVIPDDFDLYIGLEEAAESFRWYESELVPGIFQTGRYAEAVILIDGSMPEADVPRGVKLRLDRQAVLTRPGAARFEVVLNEGILHRPVGGPKVMAEQLNKLVEVSELPNVSLRIMPFDSGGHRGIMSGPFVILDFPRAPNGNGASEPTTIYVEGWTGALYLDKPKEVERYEDAWADLTKRSLDEDASRDRIRAAARRMK